MFKRLFFLINKFAGTCSTDYLEVRIGTMTGALISKYCQVLSTFLKKVFDHLFECTHNATIVDQNGCFPFEKISYFSLINV